MAFSLWRGPNRPGDINVHRVVTRQRSGYSVCILTCRAFRPGEHRSGDRLELRNGKGERLDISLQAMLLVPGTAFVGEVDSTKAFDWGS